MSPYSATLNKWRMPPLAVALQRRSYDWIVAKLVRIVAALTLLLPLLPADAGAALRDIRTVHRELLLLVQGGPVAVQASPVLCPGGAGGPGSTAESAIDWYFGKEGCRLTYPPRPSAVVSSASESGWKEKFFPSKENRDRFEALLRETQSLLRAGRATPQQRLMIQSTVWETVYGMKRVGKRDAEMEPLVTPSLRLAFGVLQLTLFSSDEAARIPDTLADLPRRANVPDIAPLVQMMLGKNSGVIELWKPTDLHADLLFGRFTARLFLTVTDERLRERFVRYLQNPKTPYEELRTLPLKFPGVQTILVLYFNVLGDRFTIVPTEQVAFWQQYTFSGKTSFDLPFHETASRIRFLTVACDWHNDTDADPVASPGQGEATDAPRCRKHEQDAMTRRSFLDVKPVIVDDRVTSRRGHCLRCHQNQVATFDTHGRRPVEFSVPFARKGQEQLTPFYIEQVQPKLRRWADAYLAGGAVEASSSPGRTH